MSRKNTVYPSLTVPARTLSLLCISSTFFLCLTGCRIYLPSPDVPRSRRPDIAYQPLPPVQEAKSAISLVNDAVSAGLHYRWVVPGKRPLTILQSIGNGCAFLDYNNDGNLDILLVGTPLALYRGDGHGHFADVTHQMGLNRLQAHFLGCGIGDYDNDGFDDIYLSGYHTGVLLHNSQGQGFTDVTKQMGLLSQPWGTSCTFADFDGDGYLDLFVGDYVQFDKSTRQFCIQNGISTSCGPEFYHLLNGVLYRNSAGKHFRDVTTAWNMKYTAANLGVAAADFDGSGHLGLALANDEIKGNLFQNPTGRQMVDITARSGTGNDRFGHYHAGMGLDWGDYDNDGRPDLLVMTFSHEDKCLYHNLGEGVFQDRGAESGVASVLEPYVSFGCKFADFDNDGWLDMIVASGHIEDNVAKISKQDHYKEPLELLRNQGRKVPAFVSVTSSAGLSKLPLIVGRGLVSGDFDNDGRIDALVVDSEGAPMLLHNMTRTSNHWIGFRLIGAGQSNRDAYGAVVTVSAGRRTLMRFCHADGSYLSSSDPRVLVGLGMTSQVDQVTVRWPDGRLTILKHPTADKYLVCRESTLAGHLQVY